MNFEARLWNAWPELRLGEIRNRAGRYGGRGAETRGIRHFSGSRPPLILGAGEGIVELRDYDLQE